MNEIDLVDYREYYDNAPDGYSTLRSDGVIIETNATHLQWLGYGKQEVSGRMRYEEFLAPEERPRFSHLLDRCQRDGSLKDEELSLLSKAGELLPVRLSMTVVRDSEGHCQGFRVTARDISQEKALEAQLLQAQKLESLGTLVAGIAHDFNNVLTGILGYTQLLLRDVEAKGRVYEKLQHIELLSERAADMIQQLLAYGRQGVSRKTGLWLHPFLKEVGKLLERMIPESIEIEFNLAADHLIVEADPTQLQQVVVNLAVNARDAMPEGGRLRIQTAQVELDEAFCEQHRDAHPGAYARLSVSDTGIGIEPEIRGRIFDPFFTTKEAKKGTGLGLPVVYGIVKKHGGAIQVETQVGRGTTVHIYLPLAEKATQPADSPVVELGQGSETILLVEDETIVLELGQTALEHFGYRVLTARDGQEALDVYREHKDEIALVILDVVMPKLGGREALKRLKRINPNVKVLLSTGYSAEEAIEDILQGGVWGVVRKPYRIHDLARAVRGALQSHNFCHQGEDWSQAELSHA